MSYLGGSYLFGYPADGAEPTNGYSVRYNSTLKKWELFSPTPALPAGTDQQVLQFVGTAITAQDLKLASKPIDNTTVPTDGMVLTYDNASGKVKFKTIPVSSVSEVQFLQGQAALGKLITATGSAAAPAANAIIASYTPANGTTFVLYEAVCNVNAQPTAGTTAGVSLRNNAVVKSTVGCQYSTLAGLNAAMNKFPVKGDQLVGTGALVYDIMNVNAITAGTVYGSICGYLL